MSQYRVPYHALRLWRARRPSVLMGYLNPWPRRGRHRLAHRRWMKAAIAPLKAAIHGHSDNDNHHHAAGPIPRQDGLGPRPLEN